MTLDDIFGAGKVINEEQFFNNIRRKIELGVIDENIVASELQAVLREIKDTRGITSLDKIIRSLSEGKFALNDEFAQNVGQKLSNFVLHTSWYIHINYSNTR